MQHELREHDLLRERTSGYRDSIQGDREREARERKEEEAREAEERAEVVRKEAVLKRRVGLRESLPEEPVVGGEGVVTVALRFADGRTGQRRFYDAVGMDVVFDWVDAMFEMEREDVILSLMSGKKSFLYANEGGSTLKEAGLGKMTALRVTKRIVEGETKEEKE